MLDHGGASRAVHAVDAQVLVAKAVPDLRAGRLRQIAHPAHAESLRVVVQAKAGAAVLVDHVCHSQPFGLQQPGQALHAGVALIGDIRQDQRQVQFKFLGHDELSG
jgi:hypothetical protein